MRFWPARFHFRSSPSKTSKTPNPSNPSTPLPHWCTPFAASSGNPNQASPVGPEGAPSSGGGQRGHRRAHSFPFIPHFGGHRQSQRAVDTDDEEELDGPWTLPQENMASSAPNDPSLMREDGFMTGPCSTCNFMAQWPSHLDRYRCEKCSMTNDLRPAFGRPGEGGPAEALSHAISTLRPGDSYKSGQNPIEYTPESRPAPPVSYIDVDWTRQLINECIDRFLLSREKKPKNAPSEDIPPSQNHTATTQSPPPAATESECGLEEPVTDPNQFMPCPSRPPPSPPSQDSARWSCRFSKGQQTDQSDPSSTIFSPVENYIIACLDGTECLNSSFLTPNPPTSRRPLSESAVVQRTPVSNQDDGTAPEAIIPDVDAKLLLCGKFAENGTWWTGRSPTDGNPARRRKSHGEIPDDRVGLKSPHINWAELNEWYDSIISVERIWTSRIKESLESTCSQNRSGINILKRASPEALQDMDAEMHGACAHLQHTLLKASDHLLRRPRRPIKSPADCRFLLILLANPMLYSPEGVLRSDSSMTERSGSQATPSDIMRHSSMSSRQGLNIRQSSVIKRILGMMSNVPSECHHYFLNWFLRYPESHFRSLVDLVGTFMSYRLTRQRGRKRSRSYYFPDGDLVPSVSGPNAGTTAQLHASFGNSRPSRYRDRGDDAISYADDWQTRSAAKVMSLLFAANSNIAHREDLTWESASGMGRSRARSVSHRRAHGHGQLIPTSAFYNTLLDYSNFISDFETWESRTNKFSFCEYPMFLSIYAKIHIMEHDARRQMELKAREAFFSSLQNRRVVSQYLTLKVRRDCLVEDSLQRVSEVVGANQGDFQKALRIQFVLEEGMDSGGLRKEWFLLLVREVFDPAHGLFVYDEDSRYCYFNPHTFEQSEQFYLVGVLLGLAIYNSTMLDVALPPFAFRKLLASAPKYTGPPTTSLRPSPGFDLEDLAEFRPALARGLRELLDYEGDVEGTFCRDFVAVSERYGQSVMIPLCEKGQDRPVTNLNRREYVDRYVNFLLESSVSRQYEPFKRGFYRVCSGNALSLFSPEEIELLIRGSDEALDVASLKSVAMYEGWGQDVDPTAVPVINWFWDSFAQASPRNQRKLLGFITASDRIPAIGSTNLVIKLQCLGEDCERYPNARTCFNLLQMYRYRSREVFERKLWDAVGWSEGFGIR